MTDNSDIILAGIRAGDNRYAEYQKDPDNPMAKLPRSEVLRQATLEIASLLSERSNLSVALDQFRACDPKPFVGTIVSVKLDKKTRRAIVHYRAAKPGENVAEDGTERISTEPVYKDDGFGMATLAKTLIGHHVLIYKQIESFTSNGETKRGRVLRWLVDLGEDQNN